MFDEMASALARGERIEIRGFGSFGVKQRRARQGRNPKTGALVASKPSGFPFSAPARSSRIEVNGAEKPTAKRAGVRSAQPEAAGEGAAAVGAVAREHT